MSIDTNALLEPISAEQPAGEDVAFDDVTDKIREARRADDPTLSQGEWQTELKTADWRQVVKLGEEVLQRRSKDLQVAGWLAEASIARDGIGGAAPAFELVAGLLDRYWDGLYPQLEGEDAEERAARLAWFNTNIAERLRRAPLSDGPTPLTLADWLLSREVENLARQNAEAYQAALDEGKPNAEAFDTALNGQSGDFIRAALDHSVAAAAAFKRLSDLSDSRLGRAAPSLDAIRTALKQIRQVLARAAQAKGLVGADAATDEAGEGSGGPATPGPAGAGASAGSKPAALQQLRGLAAYFRQNEPHSPVAFLLEKAVAWADMPLDQWLAEVVRDENVLAGIRDRIGAS